MKVIANGEEILCSKAAKGEDFIDLYDGANNLIASFRGISDFSGYSIVGGEWSNPMPTEQERRDAQIFYTAMITDTLLPEEDEDDV